MKDEGNGSGENAPHSNGDIPSSTREAIHIAEDDAGLSRLIARKLSSLGYRVSNSRDGAGALSLLGQKEADILLLDYRLPDMDGRQLVESLSRLKRLPPFIIITGEGDEKIAVEMMKLGAKDYLVKDSGFLDLLPQVVKQTLFNLEVERKLAEAESKLRQSEERLKLALEAADEGMWDYNLKTKELFLSPRAFEITGIDPENFKDPRNKWKSLLHPEDKPSAVEAINEYVRGIAGLYQDEYRLEIRPGEYKWLLVRGRAVECDEKSAPVRMAGTIKDISERKRVEDERNRLINELSEALAEVKKLSGLLPICSYCKRIRDDQGYWSQVEEYIVNHSEAEFSHGLCPECAIKFHGDTVEPEDLS